MRDLILRRLMQPPEQRKIRRLLQVLFLSNDRKPNLPQQHPLEKHPALSQDREQLEDLSTMTYIDGSQPCKIDHLMRTVNYADTY